MKLNTYEKQSLRNFLGLYLGSSFVLMVVIALLFVAYAKNLLLENTKIRLQDQANKITQDVIEAHMQAIDEPFKTLAHKHSHARFVLLDRHNRVLFNYHFGNATSLTFFSQATHFPSFWDKNNTFYLVDNKTFGHLGVHFVIVQEDHTRNLFAPLYKQVLLVFLCAFVCVGGIAIFLAQLFLKPLKDEVARIDAFSKDIAHELNTPIATLLMGAKALLKAEDNPKTRGILMSAQRIYHLYNQLAYIFMEDLRHEEVHLLDLQNLISVQINSFEPIANFYKLTLSHDLKPKTLKACEEDIVTLVGNLLMNAIKYNQPHGFVRVCLDQDLIITNSGRAIPPHKIEELTRRYIRIEGHTQGYGIGLDLVRRICDRYGFVLKITSTPNPTQPSQYENTFKVILERPTQGLN
ncbi:Signal-transducing protein, histidine kinase CrdS [Helicobacter bizzozeronii]|nr:Signal-transducing protein, histidine kinase CrdS [Helicobacter bizzozeronii]